MRNRCTRCGRDTGDRHWICWRCRRGLAHMLKDPEVEKDHVMVHICTCANPRPQFIPLFGGYECGKCGYKIIESDQQKPAIGAQEGL